MKLLLILSLLGQHAPDAGEGKMQFFPIERGALLLADGGVVDVRGGTWFSEPLVMAMGKEHAGLVGENAKYEAQVGDVPYKWVAGALVVGIAVGAALGGTTARVLPR